MEQATGNAREDLQAALRHSRAARLRRRIAWCDSELATLRLVGSELDEAAARRGLEVHRLRTIARDTLNRITTP